MLQSVLKTWKFLLNGITQVMGLQLLKLKEWGEFPVFMLNGKTGIAIFSSNPDDEKCHSKSKNIKIDHFAFNVSNEDFKKAQDYFKSINEPFDFQDHHYLHSIYLKDPDNHTVELTTLLVDENEFFK